MTFKDNLLVIRMDVAGLTQGFKLAEGKGLRRGGIRKNCGNLWENPSRTFRAARNMGHSKLAHSRSSGDPPPLVLRRMELPLDGSQDHQLLVPRNTYAVSYRVGLNEVCPFVLGRLWIVTCPMIGYFSSRLWGRVVVSYFPLKQINSVRPFEIAYKVDFSFHVD